MESLSHTLARRACGNSARAKLATRPPKAGRTTLVISATQSLRRLICRVLIGVFVFAQFAVAAYACPELSGQVVDHPDRLPSVAVQVPSGTPAVDGSAHGLHADGNYGYAAVDPGSPHLCMAHCQAGNQSADHTPAPTISPALLTVMYTLPPAEEAVVARAHRTNLLLGGPPGASEPPHAILHCCLRD